MSSFVFMKILESTPQRYDLGMRVLTGGRIERAYEAIAERAAAPGRRVLDIGCGTGGVARACAARGADVVAIDVDAGMLEVARAKAPPPRGRVEWLELGAAELEDRFGKQAFDAAVSCLAFSELTPDERRYVLDVLRSRLRPGGRLVLADEERPHGRLARWSHRLRRIPAELLTYAIAQSTTRAVPDLAGLVRDAGFADVRREELGFRDLVLVEARCPEEEP